MPLPRRSEVRGPVAYPTLHEAPDPYRYGAVPSRAATVYLEYSGWGLAPEREESFIGGRKIRLVPGARPSLEVTDDPESLSTPQTVVLARPYGTQVYEAHNGALPPEEG